MAKGSEDWRDWLDKPEGQWSIWADCYEGRVTWRIMYRSAGSVRSQSILSGGIDRPEGKSVEECLEAAIFRVSSAVADGRVTLSPAEDSTGSL